MASKVVVLWSGGIDSTAVLYHYLLKTNKEVAGLFVNYQQLASKREHLAIQQLMQIGRKDVQEFSRFLGIRTITTELAASPSMRGYIPARNTVLATIGYNHALSLEADTVAIGVSIPDHKDKSEARYPDCTSEWVSNINILLYPENVFLNSEVTIAAPFVLTPKSEVIKWCHENKVPLYATFSCYSPREDGSPCGVCGGCRSR